MCVCVHAYVCLCVCTFAFTCMFHVNWQEFLLCVCVCGVYVISRCRCTFTYVGSCTGVCTYARHGAGHRQVVSPLVSLHGVCWRVSLCPWDSRSLSPSCWEYRGAAMLAELWCGSWDLSSGPHGYKPHTLPAEPSLYVKHLPDEPYPHDQDLKKKDWHWMQIWNQLNMEVVTFFLSVKQLYWAHTEPHSGLGEWSVMAFVSLSCPHVGCWRDLISFLDAKIFCHNLNLEDAVPAAVY